MIQNTPILELWKALQEQLKVVFSNDIFNTWFKPLECDSEAPEGKMILLTSNEFATLWLQNNYQEILEKKLAQLTEHPLVLEFKTHETKVSATAPQAAITTKPVAKAIKTANASGQLTSGQGLSPQNTFENFIVGAGSQLAHAAAVAVANAPGRAYNPLFLYGNTGLGKTHLMQAVGHHVLKNQPNAKVIYITTERFTNDFIYAIQENQLSKFRKKYRGADVLLIDDIHFLAGKERIQEEFFHTFNAIYGQDKQIILSADCHPSQIATLSERLKTRFEGGLMAQVLPPDIETKIAIIQRKAEEKKYILSTEVATYLAENSGGDVRSLEGLLNKVIFASLLHEEPITISLAMSALKQAVNDENKEVMTTTNIINTVCSFYGVSKTDLLGKKRNKELVEPRQICIYLITELMNVPLMTIGQAMGGRDHTTVMHARDKITELIQTNPRVATEVNDLKNLILKK